MAQFVSPMREELEVFNRTPGCITVAVSAWPPLLDMRRVPYFGSHASIFRLVMERLGWCYFLAATPDGQWGENLNGTWTGMMGMVVRQEADMALGPLIMTAKRYSAVDFAPAYMNSDSNFLYKTITTIEPDMLTFTNSFTEQVWQYIFMTLLGVAISGGVLSILNSRLRCVVRASGRAVQRAESKRSTAVRSLLWSVRMLLGQDPVWLPRGNSGRVLAVIWMLICSILSYMYRCNLKAILITNKVQLPFDSLEEFVQQDEYKWSLVDGTYYTSFFEMAHNTKPDTVQGKMWPLRGDPVQGAASVINVTLSKKVGVISPRIVQRGFLSDDFSANGECRLTYTKKGFHDVFFSYAFPKNSPLKESVDMMLLHIIEAGFPDQIMIQELRNATWCINPKTSNSESRPLAFGDFVGLFVLYGIGCGAGLLSLLVECYVHKMRSERRHGGVVVEDYVRADLGGAGNAVTQRDDDDEK